MPIPQNAQELYSFLVGKGLSPNAAAGILGNIEQESGGNPESVGTGGGGLIGWTPLPGGVVTHNSAHDLQAQQDKIIQYIQANGSISDINAHASSPTSAATWFMSHYERPNVQLENQANRVNSANEVARAAQTGKWQGVNSPTQNNAGAGIGGDIWNGTGIPEFFGLATKFLTGGDSTGFHGLMWILTPSNWVRIGAFFAGIILLMIAIYALISVGEGGPALPKLTPMPVPV